MTMPGFDHATCISVAGEGELTGEGDSLRVVLHLGPQQSKRISIDVAPVFLGERLSPWFGAEGEPTEHFAARSRRLKWLKDASDLDASNARVQSAWSRAATDLYALQRLEGEGDEIFTPIAGVPKYSGLFGRDSLVAGIQSLELNRSTLGGALPRSAHGRRKRSMTATTPNPARSCIRGSSGPLRFSARRRSSTIRGLFRPGLLPHRRRDPFRPERRPARLRGHPRQGRGYSGLDGPLWRHRRRRVLRVPDPRQGRAKNQGWKDSGQAILYPDGAYVRDPSRSPRCRVCSMRQSRQSPAFSPSSAKANGRLRCSMKQRRSSAIQ